LKNVYLKLIFLLLFVLVFTTGYAIGQPIKTNIEEINIKSHIDILTSAKYEGRLIGTKGNEKTVEYIENHFKSIGLHSFIEEGYKKEFETVSFQWNGSPRFNVINNNGDIVDSYEEGKDFTIRLDNMSIGGSFKGNITQVIDSKELIEGSDKFKDKAILINYEDGSIKKLGLSQEEVDDRLYYIGKTSVIIYPESHLIKEPNINLGYKNKWLPTKGFIKIGVNERIYEKLNSYTNGEYKLDIDVPISFNKALSNNIYGFIPGSNYPNGNYIIIATSIDGLGMNWKKERYPEVSDNAASTSLMLELARVLAAKEEKIDSTIVFAGFNGKHIGSVGIMEYLRDFLVPPEKTEIIYLDNVSASEDSTLKIATFLNPRINRLTGKKVLNQFDNISNQLEISHELDDSYVDGEHILFRNSGIVASILTYNNNENIGTTLNTASNINLSKIKEVGILINNYIEYYGNKHLLLEVAYIFMATWWLIPIGAVLVLLKCYISNKSKQNKLELWLNSKPIITTYLLMSFFITVLIMQTKHNISEITGLLIQDVNVTSISLGYMLANNIFTTLPMIAYLSIVLVLIILSITILHYFSKRSDKINYLLFVSLVTYIVFIKGFNNFYDYRYSIIYPKLLSFYNSQYIVVLLILLFSLFVTWIFNKETQTKNYLKLTIMFLAVFITLTTFTYSPYVISKEVINLKATGSRLKL